MHQTFFNKIIWNLVNFCADLLVIFIYRIFDSKSKWNNNEPVLIVSIISITLKSSRPIMTESKRNLLELSRHVSSSLPKISFSNKKLQPKRCQKENVYMYVPSKLLVAKNQTIVVVALFVAGKAHICMKGNFFFLFFRQTIHKERIWK